MKAIKWIMMFTVMFISIAKGGIPEPGFVMYGEIRNDLGGANVRLTSGVLTWTLTPDGGSPVTVQTTLTNLNDQFSYWMDVPFESPVPGMAPSPNKLQLTATPVLFDRSQVSVDGFTASIVGPATNVFSFSQADRGKLERVDLQIQIQFPDSDGDGLPDFWEIEYFGNYYAKPQIDSDGDGMSNLQEYLAGTDPNDAESVALIKAERNSQSGFVISWQSEKGRYYKILRSRNLLSGFAPLAAGISATPPKNSYMDTNAVGMGLYFYRVRIE